MRESAAPQSAALQEETSGEPELFSPRVIERLRQTRERTETAIGMVENLGSQIYRNPRTKTPEFTGWAVPELVRFLRTTVHSEIADLLFSKEKEWFEEAQRRLAVIIQHGKDRELVDKIIEVLALHPTPIVKVPPKPDRRKLKEPNLPMRIPKITRPENGAKALGTEAPAPKGRQRRIKPLGPTLTGVNIRADPTKTLLAVSLGGPEGVISPEMRKLNPWRDDLILPPEKAGISRRATRTGQHPEKILKDAGPAKRRAYPGKVTNRIGGKTSLMPRYDTETEPLIPRQRFDTFIDACGGSLAVTAYMVRTGRIGPETHTVVCERHRHLAEVYKAIRMDVERLIKWLTRFKKNQSVGFYNQKVEEYNLARDLKEKENPIYAAARYIYLLASCIGSTLRESGKSGHINVIPRTGEELAGVKIFDPTNLRLMSLVLQNATIIEGSHEEARRFLQPSPAHAAHSTQRALTTQQAPAAPAAQPRTLANTCYFADPPYHGQETTNEYGVPPFDENCQRSIAQTARMVHERGGMAIVTNSDTPFIRDLYRWMPVKKEISVGDSLSGVVGQKRQELFLSSYTLKWMGGLM